MTTPRATVHATAASPHGASDPHQEGPADLRLVAPALAAWAAAAIGLDAPGAGVAVACGVAVALGAVALRVAVVRRRAEREPGAEEQPGVAPRADTGRRGAESPRCRSPRLRSAGAFVALTAVLLCAAAGAASAVLHASDLRRGPLPVLAEQYARVTVELEVTGDPRLTRPKVRGSQRTPPVLVFTADAVRVTAPDGEVTAVRTPSLVVVQQPGGGRGAGGGNDRAEGRGGPSNVDAASRISAALPRNPGAPAQGPAAAPPGPPGVPPPPAAAPRGSTGVPPAPGAAPVASVSAAHSSPAVLQTAVTSTYGSSAAPPHAVTGPYGSSTVPQIAATTIPQSSVADPPPSGAEGRADARGGIASAWRGLLPSTRIRVVARAAPPLASGDQVAAVLRVTAEAPPVKVGAPDVLQRLAGSLRAGLREASSGLRPDARALLPGLVVGDTSRVPPDLDDAFRATDLTHLLAVSGSNLTIVLALLIGPPHLASRAERRGLAPRLGLSLRGTAVIGGALALAFVVVCRPDPSVLRAAACGLITLLAIGTGRRRSLLPALAAAVLLLVLYDPWLARSYGFLLSVLATGALLLLAPRWSAALQRRRVPPRLAEVIAAAAAAQAVCAPVVAVLAARVGLVAVPCNLLAELAVAPATVLGFAALAAAPVVPPVAQALAWCAGWPAEWIAGVARTGAALPGAEFAWPGGWAGGMALAAAMVVLVPVGRRVLRRPWLCFLCALAVILAVCRPAPFTRVLTGWPPPGWRAVVCDVGQGDGLVLAAGDGTALVVDTGPEPHAMDRCLTDLGIRRIPLLVLTHFHADHVDGLPGALRGRSVGAIETTTLQEPPGQAQFVRSTAAAARVPIVRATPGERRHLGPLTWEVLWPPAPPARPGPSDPIGPRDSTNPTEPHGSTKPTALRGSAGATDPHGSTDPYDPTGFAYPHRQEAGSGGPYDSGSSGSPGSPGIPGSPGSPSGPDALDGPNDASVTLLVRTGGLTILLLGDLEPPAQRGLFAAHPELGGVDVLKVAHHGSAYQDPPLIHRLAPRLALISCGADNPYGHPAPRTIAALRAQGARVLRTDTDGAIAILGTEARLSATVTGHRVKARMANGPRTRTPTHPGAGRAEVRTAGNRRSRSRTRPLDNRQPSRPRRQPRRQPRCQLSRPRRRTTRSLRRCLSRPRCPPGGRRSGGSGRMEGGEVLNQDL
ncbi:ComEC/Rec2 family competence protein [Streptomyces sp. Je 1-4]|uniref:ComEC/Rec2 family competence protein n=1 Tax=Streptomyces TaxID=1883 RepID=UPI0021D8F060|nr:MULTISPECIES: ComEC/Rec2 family competence protein [unclassified Streptomyces]UYB42464.1 ComEC/Rec2 family competence protein [Streptomyces sp. Je 1-4]UZQ38773.1 ComEC/Rec2 family competence protein [Streptomyces sp. Je 1-4] [Streptomyces sp. Je 1-4 4N24]UZQ46190.1 ComEC/Rec2 family competence protein [Streptomyces sp. Je 1-4] [Streptomyces sp. Je 1-4 4N24_ara]